MLRLAVPRELEHVGMADQVGLDVGAGIFEAVADAGLRAQMDDAVDVDLSAARFSPSASAKSVCSKRKRSPKSRARLSSRACFSEGS